MWAGKQRATVVVLATTAALTNAFTTTTTTRTRTWELSSKDDNNEVDLFEYFDPLLSPHAYPNGIGNPIKPPQPLAENEPPKEKEAKPFQQHIDLLKEISKETAQASSINTQEEEDQLKEEEDLDLLDYFDPLLSPHEYPDGIEGAKKKKLRTKHIALLLIDHGSRNAKSNELLHTIASNYQERIPPHSGGGGGEITTVRASHMEIASPSIPEVLNELMEDSKIDEIVCLPYFLSPYGRHVSEDIQNIIQDFIQEKQNDHKETEPPLPIITITQPLGSKFDFMMSAMTDIIQEESKFL